MLRLDSLTVNVICVSDAFPVGPVTLQELSVTLRIYPIQSVFLATSLNQTS